VTVIFNLPVTWQIRHDSNQTETYSLRNASIVPVWLLSLRCGNQFGDHSGDYDNFCKNDIVPGETDGQGGIKVY